MWDKVALRGRFDSVNTAHSCSIHDSTTVLSKSWSKMGVDVLYTGCICIGDLCRTKSSVVLVAMLAENLKKVKTSFFGSV